MWDRFLDLNRMNKEEFLGLKAAELDAKQRKYLRKYKVARYTIVPLNFLLKIGFYVMIVVSIIFPPALLILVGIIVLWVILYLVYKDPREAFEEYVKEELLPEIFKKYYPQYFYEPYEYNQKGLQESGFFSKSFFDKSIFTQGEDHVTGSVKGIDVDFSEVYFYKDQILWFKSILQILFFILLLPIAIVVALFQDGDLEFDGSLIARRTINYYRGLFVSADFHKDLQGQDIMLIPRKLETTWEKFRTKIFSSKYTEIKVEHPLINERFKVLTTNTRLGYYALSPSLLQTIVDIIEYERVTPMISLKNDRLYMSIPWQHDYFDVKLTKPIDGYKYLKEYFLDLDSFERMITSFKLDVRIWSKI